MARLPETRHLINSPFNCAPLCNQCNTNITHGKRVVERVAKLRDSGLECITEWGFDPGDYSDEELIGIGALVTQAWILAMKMKSGNYDVNAMAEL